MWKWHAEANVSRKSRCSQYENINNEKYEVQFANIGRLHKSHIIYVEKLLNEEYLQKQN